MRVRQFHIERFRSLQNVTLENMGDFVVFIGANGSGKSNLLEAFTIFFNGLNPALEQSIGGLDDYVWFGREDSSPILFSTGLEFERSELTNLALDESAFKIADKNSISIERKIEGPRNSAKWKTLQVVINDVPIVKDGALVEAAKGAGNIWAHLVERLQNKFTYLSAARDVTAPQQIGTRVSFIDTPTLNALIQLGQSRDARQSRQWIQLEGNVTRYAPSIEDIRVQVNEMVIREKEGEIPIPITLLGGGNQGAISLMYRVQQGMGEFFAIEEPETHLHPALERQLLDYLREVSHNKQTFISTHSCIFVDQTNLDSVWIVRRGKRGTEVIKIESPKQLHSVLYEVGSRPSDIFFAEAVIFVEGLTEEKVIPIWASKIGIDLLQRGVRVRPTNGKDSGKYHLEVLIEATQNAAIPFFMILDKDAEKQAKKLIGKGLIRNKNLFLLQKGEIEEYYPADKFTNALKETLKSEYDLELAEEEVASILEGPRCDKVEAMLLKKLKLKKAPKAWKPIVGEIVAQAMDVEEIDSEIRGIIERIITTLRLQ